MIKIVDAVKQDTKEFPLTELKVDGGMTVNNLMLQLQADTLCIPVGELMHTFTSPHTSRIFP